MADTASQYLDQDLGEVQHCNHFKLGLDYLAILRKRQLTLFESQRLAIFLENGYLVALWQT